MFRLSLILIAALTLTSCSDTKEKLKGKREPIVMLQDDLTLSKTLKLKEIVLPAAQRTEDWQQVGYDATNTPPHAQLAKNLKPLWSANIGSGSYSRGKLLVNIVSGKDYVYAMDARGTVSAIDLNTGQKKWSLETSPSNRESDTLGGGLCLNGDTLYIVTSFSQALAVDAKTGQKKWEKTIQGPSRASPCVAANRLYIITVANEIVALNAQDGQELWNYTGLPESSSLLGGGKVAVKGDILVGALSSGEIVALNTLNGSPLWVDALTSAVGFESESNISDIRARPIIYKDTALFISHGGRMLAQNYDSGNRIWQKDIGGMRSPALANDFVFMVTNHEELVCIDMNSGGVKWVKNLPSDKNDSKVRWAGPILAGEQLILTSSDGRIGFFSPQDGSLKSTLNVSSSCYFSPIVVKGTLLALSDNGTLHAWR